LTEVRIVEVIFQSNDSYSLLSRSPPHLLVINNIILCGPGEIVPSIKFGPGTVLLGYCSIHKLFKDAVSSVAVT